MTDPGAERAARRTREAELIVSNCACATQLEELRDEEHDTYRTMVLNVEAGLKRWEAAIIHEETGTQWISVSTRLPKAGKLNPVNTHPKNYFIRHKDGRVTFDCIWLNADFEAWGITHWAEAALPPAPEEGGTNVG